ncbi:MAG: hypothetical protein QW412_03535 [Candidatus Aenigmatarchaeota archaeon]
MLDIKLIREKPELMRNNLKRKQDLEKLKMFDELLELDKKFRNFRQKRFAFEVCWHRGLDG